MRKRTSASLPAVLLLTFISTVAVAQDTRRTVSIGTQLRVSAPTRWQVSSRTPNAVELVLPSNRVREQRVPPPAKGQKAEPGATGDASMLVVIEPRRNHDEALRRLEEIAAERPEEPRKLLIGGWPAIERTYRAPLPLLGDQETGEGNPETLFTTTAIASGASIVRFETTLLPHADPAIAEEALSVARTYRGVTAGPAGRSRWELDRLQIRLPKPFDTQEPRPGGGDGRDDQPQKRDEASPGVAVSTRAGLGELEVAATNNGANVVVATNTGFSFSTNFGAGWTDGGNTPCNQVWCDGDPSLAVGQSGAIYYAWLGGPSATQVGDGISRSTDNGQTFPFRAMAVNCPGVSSCQFADQEHIAADRFNAGASGDRVYNVWRNFTATTLSSIRIVCSSDGGSTWGTQLVIGAGDFPRVSVGLDGSVYVGWASGGNMMLNKYSACNASNNLTQQTGWPITVSAFANVVCPVPGLDRCNGRNILSSPTIAVDELDPNHVYYAFATNTAAGNEDVMLRHSSDGGATFPRSVRVNTNVAGRRFLPWLSVYGGVAAVSWYDRRNATVAQNDSTRFFIGAAKLNGPALVALTETDLSGNNDQQCSTWPCGTNAMTDSESCSVQPQLAGRCGVPGGVLTNTPCDFSTSSCVAPQVCRVDRGCPKYGDYNGNAAAGGRFYSAWASAVAPVGTTAPGAGINVYTSMDRMPSDFYVRDWTTSATTRDTGVQPSTNSNFWTSSDVWNQSTNTVATPVNDWILGDAPSRSGSNFAFARVSRRAPAMATAPPAAVTVRFAYADFGAGLNFLDLGTEPVTFAPGDLTKFTAGHSWGVPATASIHLCLVAQIDGPDGDTFAPPSVVGLTPGAGIALIVPDNNKAQRNLQETVGSAGGAAEMFAIVRNDRQVRRSMRLRVNVPANALDAEVRVIGGKTFPLQRRTIVEVGDLEPGETRWVQFRANKMPQQRKPVAVDFADDTPGGSGFTIRVVTAQVETVAAHHMRMWVDVMLRLAELQQSSLAKEEAARAMEVGPKIDVKRYLAFLRERSDVIDKLISTVAGERDPADLRGAVTAFRRGLESDDADAVTGAHNAVIERLDAHLTMLVRRGK